MKQASVFIIIVNWNGEAYLADCLLSLIKLRTNNDIQVTIVVVDNGSTDGSVKLIQQKFKQVKLIPLPQNLGFSGGNNVGIKYAIEQGADYIWFLNNDTYVDPKALTALVKAFANPKVGAVGSKIYFAPNHEFHRDRYKPEEKGKVIWYAGGIIDWDNVYASHRGVDEVDHGQYDKLEKTPFITGCSFMIKSSVINQVGVFDEHYYLYLEDVDFSLRIQKAGYETLYVPDSVVWHINAGSSGRPGNPTHEYYFTRNRLLLGFRYAPVRTKLALFRESLRMLTGKNKVRKQAILDAFLGKWGKQKV